MVPERAAYREIARLRVEAPLRVTYPVTRSTRLTTSDLRPHPRAGPSYGGGYKFDGPWENRMIFERFKTPGIASVSYLVGDSESGEAVVVDPGRDLEKILAAARTEGLTIRYIPDPARTGAAAGARRGA